MRLLFRIAPLAFFVLFALPALARDPLLGLPIDCTLGEDCFIQNYVDADPGDGAADFTCGPLSYDGHSGTDFALPSMAAMAAGVNVLAAAPGVVRALRDGMPDTGRDGTPAELLDGQECGNGVVVDHGDGWTTQYCHMKSGSVAVQKGERVRMGTVLGQVGFSGQTQFPHVHVTVRDEGAVVDPFNRDDIVTCGGAEADDSLWITPLPYVPGAIIAVGIDKALPDYDTVKSGAAAHDRLAADAAALVGWGYVFGGQAGDEIDITLTRPDGSEMLRKSATLDKTQAQLFRAAGRKRPEAGWPLGDWRVDIRLLRGGVEIDALSRVVTIGE